jgi:hypothetical protein
MEKSMDPKYNRRECSFTPEISKQSRRLLKKKEHNKEFQKVEDRLLGYIKKTKTGIIGQTTNHQSSSQGGSISQRPTAGSFSMFETKEERQSSRKKFGIGATSCDLQQEMEAVYESMPKIERLTDCSKDLMFSFKKYLLSPQGLPEVDHEIDRSAEINWRKSDKKHIKSRASDAFESLTSRDYEKEKDKILKQRKDELRRRNDELKEPQREQGVIKSREITLRTLKKSTQLPKKESFERSRRPSKDTTVRVLLADDNCLTSISSKHQMKPQRSVSRKLKMHGNQIDSHKESHMSNQDVRKHHQKLSHKVIQHKEELSIDRVTSAVTKPPKIEMIEKYGVKVKQPSLACAQIQETVFAGDTTSMIENLKKLNRNLRNCSNLQCIIKKNEMPIDFKGVSKENRAISGSFKTGINQMTPRMGGLETKHIDNLHSGRNPFLELVNQASFGTN